MTIAFGSGSLSFGNVAVGSTVSQTVTVTNSDTRGPATISVSNSAFTLSATSVPAAVAGSNDTISDGSVVVTVSFAPTLQQLYQGNIGPTSGTNPQCGVSGTGVTASSLTAAGSDPNQFGSEGTTGGSSEDTGDKYFQIAVPNFGLDGSTRAGNSFVRLGSFPDLVSPTDAPPGFTNSLSLANLVGESALITAVEGSPPGADAVPSGFMDGSGLTPPTYGDAGDPTFLLGFSDDTRQRGTPDDGTMSVNSMAPQILSEGATVPNTSANRQAETLTLLTKGGWWDHSDGNRVTTTSGDKIEIIQGNDKLVVLGRQPLPTTARSTTTKADPAYMNLVDNAFITDVSGGHFQEQYPSPTPCIKTIEYSQDGTTGEWTLYQDNSLGNLITKYAGRTVDLFQGSSREVYVGLSPDDKSPPATMPGTTYDPVLTSVTFATSSYTQLGSEEKPVGWDTTTSSWITSVTGTDEMLPAIGPRSPDTLAGDSVTKTWAQRVRSYTGSAKSPVIHVYAETYANEIETYTLAASIVTTNLSANNLTVTGGIAETINVGAQLALNLAVAVDIWTAAKISLFPTSDKLTYSLVKTEANATKAELTQLKTAIRGWSNHIATKFTAIAADTTTLAVKSDQIATSLNCLAADVMVGA